MTEEPLRFGLVGTGRITSWILKGAEDEPRFQATAICSRSMRKAREFAECHHIPHCYDQLEDMLSSDEIDAIYIGTPNQTHCELAIRCMDAGKHVLCEKPLGTRPDEVRKMMEAARRNHVVLMEAMMSTLNPNFIRLQEKLPELGTLRKYHASFCQYSSKYEMVKECIGKKDWEQLPSSFHPLRDGGALKDIGIYTIYPMVVLFGRPLSVKAQEVSIQVPVAPDCWQKVDIQGGAEFEYPTMIASVSWSKVADSYLPTEISGEAGNLLMDKINVCRKLTYLPHPFPASGKRAPAEMIDLSAEHFESEYTCELKEFIHLVRGEKSCGNNTLENSLIVSELMEEIRSQLEKEKEVRQPDVL